MVLILLRDSQFKKILQCMSSAKSCGNIYTHWGQSNKNIESLGVLQVRVGRFLVLKFNMLHVISLYSLRQDKKNHILCPFKISTKKNTINFKFNFFKMAKRKKLKILCIKCVVYCALRGDLIIRIRKSKIF